MSLLSKKPKLTFTLLRVQGKKVKNTQWTTTNNAHIIGLGHPLFAQFSGQNIYIGGKHLELQFDNDHWYIKNIHTSLVSSLDAQLLQPNTNYPIKHGTIIEMGFCQILVSDHKHLDDTEELKNILQINDLASTGLIEEGIEL